VSKHHDREDVQQALDKLIQRQQVRVRRDQYHPDTDSWTNTGPQERHTVPSLWEQLVTSTSWGSGAAGQGAFGSRPVIATGVVSLRNEIEQWALRAVEEHVNPTPAMRLTDARADAFDAQTEADYAHHVWELIAADAPVAADGMTPEFYVSLVRQWRAELDGANAAFEAADQQRIAADDRVQAKAHTLIPDTLRAIASHLTDQYDLNWWHDTLRTWAREIRTALALDPSRPQWARGAKCPDCNADSATTKQDGETVRTPALAIAWAGPAEDEHHPDSAWKVRAVECRACGRTWWHGEELNTLVDAMLGAPVA
jgi:hypothetical protein